jgi:hypothetical protein
MKYIEKKRRKLRIKMSMEIHNTTITSESHWPIYIYIYILLAVKSRIFCVLPTECTSIFHTILRISSGNFPIQPDNLLMVTYCVSVMRGTEILNIVKMISWR